MNNTTTTTSGLDVGRTWLEVVELILLIHICVLTLFGNFMVILAFVCGPRSIRSLANYFVVNLAVSDLLVGCVSLPFWTIHRFDSTLMSGSLFNGLVTLDVLAGVTSILSLSAISVERMTAVKFPALHTNMTKKPVLVAITVTWCCGLTVSQTNHL
eukprot:UN26886